MKTIITLLLSTAFLMAGDFQGSFSTGIYMGTPTWNAGSYDDYPTEAEATESLLRSESYLRSVNRLRLKGSFGSVFSYNFNALRSDNFGSDPHLDETKIYRAYGQLDFSKMKIQIGRINPFNRWVWGSVDGGAFSVKVNNKLSFSAFGGMNVRYGKLYDADNNYALAYADMMYRGRMAAIKIKAYYDEDVTKIGTDFFGRISKLKYSANYGYDITNSRIADGGLSLFYPLTAKFTASGNYRLFRTDDWKFSRIEFEGYLIERLSLGLRYRLFSNYYIDLKQMLSMTSENSDYITFLNFSARYFNVGVNYLAGQSELQRWNVNLGLRYAPLKNLNLSAGVSPVGYMYPEDQDYQNSLAVYFRASYQFLKHFTAATNFHFYQDNNVLESSYRGGLLIRYNFGG